MSPWLPYCLLGAAAGPFVIAFASTLPRRESPSWSTVTRSEPIQMLAASALLSFTLAQAAERRPTVVGAVSWLVIVGLLLTLIDWSCHRLPHRVVGALLGGGIAQFGLTAFVEHDGRPLVRASAAAAAVLATTMTISLVSPSGWGDGDVTLSTTIAFFLGWFSWWHVFTGFFVALLLGVVTFGVLRVRRAYRHDLQIPFGPALVFAPVCTILIM